MREVSKKKSLEFCENSYRFVTLPKRTIAAFLSFLLSISFAKAEEIKIGDWDFRGGAIGCQIQYNGWIDKVTLQAHHFTGLDGHHRIYRIFFKPLRKFWQIPMNHGTNEILIRSENFERVFHYTGATNNLEIRNYGTHRIINRERVGLIDRARDLTNSDLEDFLTILTSGAEIEFVDSTGVIYNLEAEGTREAVLAFNRCREIHGL